MEQEFQKDIVVTSRGQLTLPMQVRKAMQLGKKRKLRLTMSRAGQVTLRPLPDVMSLFGSLKNELPHDLREKAKARHAIGKQGLSRN